MGTAASDEREVLRVLVEAPWLLGTEAECVIGGLFVILRDTGSGAQVRLGLSDFSGRAGRVLYFHSRARSLGRGCIEFAEMGGDAWYQVACADEATAATAAARIKQAREELFPRT